MAHVGPNGIVKPSNGELLCDPLTLLVSYPSFQDYLVEQFPALASQGMHLTIGDVDDLKRFVTTCRSTDPQLFGHIAGNECMQRIGQIVAQWADSAFCPSDFFLPGAFGGDEIIIAASGMSYAAFSAGVQDLAMHIREGAPRPVSFAMATTAPTSCPISDAYGSIRNLIVTLDMTLFECKQQRSAADDSGRGIVIDVGELPAEGPQELES